MTAQISPPIPAHFEQNYQRLLNCLKLAGLQPKIIALYSHEVRRAAGIRLYPEIRLILLLSNSKAFASQLSARKKIVVFHVNLTRWAVF